MSQTLVLNADGNPLSIVPLSIISWKDAVRLVFADKVTVLECYEKIVSSPSISMAMPSVIITKKYYKNRYVPEFSKTNLLYRDDFKCQYCGNSFHEKDLTMDHVIPKSKGGKKTFDNIVMSCRRCNEYKADKYIKPIKKPRSPTYYELVHNRKKYPLLIADKIWQKYLNWDESLILMGHSKLSYRLINEEL
jgi:5-methylcytosine-specific restriction endonuclease McrA